jgi:hypothetical protein
VEAARLLGTFLLVVFWVWAGSVVLIVLVGVTAAIISISRENHTTLREKCRPALKSLTHILKKAWSFIVNDLR